LSAIPSTLHSTSEWIAQVTVAGTVSAMLQRTPRLLFGDPPTKKIKAIPELDTLELADYKKRDRAAEPGAHSFEQQERKCVRSMSTGTPHSRSCDRSITDRSYLPRHVVFRSITRRWLAFETSTTWYVFANLKRPQPDAAVSNASTFESRSWAIFRASGFPYVARKLAILSYDK
jgi:hypothetical protein